MNTLKSAFADNLLALTNSVLVELNQNQKASDPYLYYLGANQAEVQVLLNKLSIALPDLFFVKNIPEVKEELVLSFIQFMSQEEIMSDSFTNNFINFIYEVTNELGAKYPQLN